MADSFGLRADGTEKGTGFFGVLDRPDGRVSTELSIGVEFDGEETQIPSLVPTLSKREIDSLLAGGKMTDAIVDKAVSHARKRLKAGKSPFAQQGEQVRLPKSRGTGMPLNAAGFLQAEDGSFLVADVDTGLITRTNERPNIVAPAQRKFFKPTELGSRLTGAMKARIDQEVDAEAAAVRSNLLSSARNLEDANSIRAFLDKNDLAGRAAVAQEKEERKKKAIFKSTQMQEALSTGENLEKLSDRVDKLGRDLSEFGTDNEGNLVVFFKGKRGKTEERAPSASEKLFHQSRVTELALKMNQLAKEELRARPLAGSIEEVDKIKTKGPLQKFLEGLTSVITTAAILGSGDPATLSRLAEQRFSGNEQVSAPQPGAVSPFPDFPDAFVEGGQWIVIRDGQKFKVVQ